MIDFLKFGNGSSITTLSGFWAYTQSNISGRLFFFCKLKSARALHPHYESGWNFIEGNVQAFFFSLLFFVNIASTATANARTVDWTTELSADLALVALTYGVQRNYPNSAVYNDDEFPTQGSDDYVAKVIHGKPTDRFWTHRLRSMLCAETFLKVRVNRHLWSKRR